MSLHIVTETQGVTGDGGEKIMSANHFSGQLSDAGVSGIFVQSYNDMQQIYILKRSFFVTTADSKFTLRSRSNLQRFIE